LVGGGGGEGGGWEGCGRGVGGGGGVLGVGGVGGEAGDVLWGLWHGRRVVSRGSERSNDFGERAAIETENVRREVGFASSPFLVLVKRKEF